MDLADNLCMNCFEKLTNGSVCGNCGFDNDSVTNMKYLPRKTVLSGRYIVGKVISEESDAVTYSGYDTERRCTVTVREFLPKGITNRLEGNSDVHVRERFRKNFSNYKNSFIRLWKTLKGLNSLSAVIPVIDVFEENETAYAVCEKMETVSLRDFLIRNEDNNILWDKARLMFMPVLTTIERLHSNGIIHGAINPDNLVLCRDGKVRLAGFCISECSSASGELEFTPSAGYTALEQYENSHKICPATDIYSFSACIYRALVGNDPPDAMARETNDKLMIPNRIAEKIPPHVIRALGGGLQIYPEKRIQSIDDFRELLNAAPSVVAHSAPIPQAEAPKSQSAQSEQRSPKPPEKKDSKKGVKTAIIVLLAVAVVAAAVYIIGFSGLVIKHETTTAATTLPKIAVPDFRAGYTESDVKNTGSWNAQFKITFVYEYTSDAEEGLVFKQSVEPGTEIEQGSEIVLTVSKGIETATVPDVGGLSKADAVSALEKAGFKVKIVTIYNDDGHKADTVKSKGGMAPAAGTSSAKGEEVLIQVYGETVTTTTAAPESMSSDGTTE